MEGLSKRKWVSLTLLSIVVPMSLLATFRLTGILQEPMTISETIMLDAVQWEFERPDHYVYLDDKLEALYINDELSATLRVVMGTYTDNAVAYSGADVVTMGIEINSATINPKGFIERVHVVLRKDYKTSIDWINTNLDFKNLSLVNLAEGYERSTRAYIGLAGVNHTRSVYLWATGTWILLTSKDQTHQMEVVYELTYYNGTAYKKIIQPFQLKIIGR